MSAVAPAAPRVGQALGSALAAAFDADPELFLLGEDVSAPYGGAFGITREVSERHGHRVRNTPLSEGGILGVANGMALMGRHVVVEVMFGDFALLVFDQLVNMTAKSVTMYGERHPMRVVLRCPVGARRGYGPTHSQSLQKHFVGVPDLVLHELSPLHDVRQQLAGLLADDRPSVLFEDKVLYTERVFPHAPGDEEHHLRCLGDWAHVRLRDEPHGGDRVVLVVPGGVARRGMTASRELRGHGVSVDLLVPGRLYPVDPEPVRQVLASSRAVLVAEEGTAGGTWGAEVARVLHEQEWDHLPGPVRTVASADTTIPAAPHLEREVVLDSSDLVHAVLAASRATPRAVTSPAPAVVPPTVPTVPTVPEVPRVPSGEPVVVPKLNNNDQDYVLVRWLVEEGAEVDEDEALLEVETSKAVQELSAPSPGRLHQDVAAGALCRPGDQVGSLGSGALVHGASAVREVPEVSLAPDGAVPLDRHQRAVAEVVTISHREVPAAFAAVRLRPRAALDAGEDLVALTLRGIGTLLDEHPLLYGHLVGDATAYLPATTADVAVTVDVGTGLSMPVVRDAGSHTPEDLIDELTDLRMRALRDRLTEDDLRDPTIALSLGPGVDVVQPLVPPGLAAVVSLSGDLEGVGPDPEVTLGLAHDHRLVNGAQAMAFLTHLADLLREPGRLAGP